MLVFLERSSATPPAPYNLDGTVPVVGQELTVIGFGKTVAGQDSYSSILKEAKVTAVTDTECINTYDEVTPSMSFCAKYSTGLTCQGDSGGPVLNANGILVGLVGFGRTNCATNKPRGYTRISTYQDWILEMICRYSAERPTYCPGDDDAPLARPPATPVATTARPPTPVPPGTIPVPPTFVSPTPAPVTRPLAPVPPARPSCGFLGLSILCLNGCGILGRRLGMCT